MDDELGKPFPDGEFAEAELRGMLSKYAGRTWNELLAGSRESNPLAVMIIHQLAAKAQGC